MHVKSSIIVLSVLFRYGCAIKNEYYTPSTDLYSTITVQGLDKEMLSTVPCLDDEDCYVDFTPGIEDALEYNSSLVTTPSCVYIDESDESGFCSCGVNCLSYSRSTNDDKFFYCGPCGRVGSECSNSLNFSCSLAMAECKNGFCECQGSGTFYELYYCYVPYYGYEVALQMAIATCIIIAGCLILVSVYNAIGFRRMRHFQHLRERIRGEGQRQSSPEDTPPKYDDIVEELPSYQEAVQMMKKNGKNSKGALNPGFEVDGNSLDTVEKDVTPHSLLKDKKEENQVERSSEKGIEPVVERVEERSCSVSSKDSVQMTVLGSRPLASPSTRTAKVKGIRKDRETPAKLDLEYSGRENVIDSKHNSSNDEKDSKRLHSDSLSSVSVVSIQL